jgi:hypothetical protein
VATIAKALRASFDIPKSGVGAGACGIAASISGPRLFSHEALPVGPAWEDVQRVIASTGSTGRAISVIGG